MNTIKEYFKNEKAASAILFIAINAAVLYILYFFIKNLGSVLDAVHSVVSSLFSAFSRPYHRLSYIAACQFYRYKIDKALLFCSGK